MAKATKQIAVIATIKMAGVAQLVEPHEDYMVFQASFATVDAALAISDELEAAYGIPVGVRS